MKTLYIYLISLFCSLLCYESKAQLEVELCENKVTQLIFPEEIKSSKGGYLPDDFAVNKDENIIYIQPLVENFTETNINVVTINGLYYSIFLKANYNPKTVNYVFSVDDAFYKETSLVQKKKIEKDIKEKEEKKEGNKIASKILSKEGYLSTRNTVRYKNFWLLIKGVYINDNRIFFRVMIQNKSNIIYDFDYVAFYVKATKKQKNTTDENTQYTPISIHNNCKSIKANETKELVFEFEKFTIGKKKSLYIDVLEKNGERNLSLKVSNTMILNAREIN